MTRKRDLHHPPVGPGDEQLSERRVDARVGDVDQPIALGADDQVPHGAVKVDSGRWPPQSTLQFLGGHRVHAYSLLSFSSPSWTLRRAAASEQSRARAMPA